MAKRGKRDKSENGEGVTHAFSITFSEDSETEMRAWRVAQYLAKPHGRRKHTIVAFLNAIGDYVEHTDEEFNPDQIAAMFMSGMYHTPVSMITKSEPIPAPERQMLKTATTDSGVSSQATVDNFFDGIDLDDFEI